MNCAVRRTINKLLCLRFSGCRPRKPFELRWAQPNPSVTSHVRSEILGVNPLAGSLELLRDCLRTAMESGSRSARRLTSTTLFLATLIALQLIYQTHSTVASRFASFRLLPIPPPLRFRLWRLVQNTKPASTLQGVFSGTCWRGPRSTRSCSGEACLALNRRLAKKE